MNRPEAAADILLATTEEARKIPNTRQRNNVIASSTVLAGLVLKKEIIQGIVKLNEMRESFIYQDIEARGKAEGKAEGIVEGKAEVALNMLQVGMDVCQIVELTGLPPVQVETLQQMLNDRTQAE